MSECIVCRNRSFDPLYGNTLKRCRNCTFTTTNIEITEDQLNSIYNINYFNGQEYLDYMRDKKVLQLNFEKRIPFIKDVLNSLPHIDNCLEIGCAYGFFGEVLLNHFKTGYTGIDIASEACDFAIEQFKLNVISGNYLDQPPPLAPWTDVFMWDVIEHLKNPHFFLQKAWKEMMQGSRIYITTGDIGAFLPRIQRRKWRMIHPPSHLHYFSRKTLGRLIENAGFKVINIKYLPVYRSARQIWYSLFLIKKSGKFSNKLFNLIPSDWYIPMNTYDVVFITAIK